jgi:methylated-DNA-[protein]-cysteine S-methyltransferase
MIEPIPPVPSAAGAAQAAARFALRAPADVHYAVLDGPAGRLVAARTARGLVRLAYDDLNGGVDAILEGLASRLSPRILESAPRLDAVRRELDEYFERRRIAFALALDWSLATPFARRVLRAAMRIPYGETSTYGAVAAAAGGPGGARAAGNALGANPIPIVVPCHRVLRGGGALGGYTGGLDRKRMLLGIESGDR